MTVTNGRVFTMCYCRGRQIFKIVYGDCSAIVYYPDILNIFEFREFEYCDLDF